jgi:transposase
MDQIHVVRHKVLVEGASIRKVAKAMGTARNTVRRYLADTPPVGRQPTERKHPVSDAVRPRLHALLGEAPRRTAGAVHGSLAGHARHVPGLAAPARQSRRARTLIRVAIIRSATLVVAASVDSRSSRSRGEACRCCR